MVEDENQLLQMSCLIPVCYMHTHKLIKIVIIKIQHSVQYSICPYQSSHGSWHMESIETGGSESEAS